jgi:TonB dependent receptor
LDEHGSSQTFSTPKDRFYTRASGLHSDHYLDPPVFQNYTNQGNSGGILAQYEHEFGANDGLRVTFLHDTLGDIVPNDLVQQNQLIGPQRQDAASTENGGQVYFQHSISPTLFLTMSGSVHESSFALRSNLFSTPVIVNQNHGYTEGYFREDIAGHRGHHDWKVGVDSFFTPVHEALAYHIINPSQFDPGTQINFQFQAQKWDVEPAFYFQDQMHYGRWNFSAGLRFDYYSFAINKAALSPRLGLSYFIPTWNLLLHAAYDRVFQTPAMENLLLASSPQLDSVSPAVLRVPVPPAQGNFYEIGLTKALFSKFRPDANVFRRDFHNYSDDDVLLQTGVSFPISYSRARITGEEVRLEVPHWGRFSGFVSYANQSGIGSRPHHRRPVYRERCARRADGHQQIRRLTRPTKYATGAGSFSGHYALVVCYRDAVWQRVARGSWRRHKRAIADRAIRRTSGVTREPRARARGSQFFAGFGHESGTLSQGTSRAANFSSRPRTSPTV